MQFLGERNYRVQVEPLNKLIILNSLKLKQDQNQLNQIFVDFSYINAKSINDVSALLKEILPYFKGVERVGFVLKQVIPDYKILEFAKNLDELKYLYISCLDNQSLDVSLQLLEKLSLRKVQTLHFSISPVLSENQQYHSRVVKVLKSMDQLDDLTLEFNTNSNYPLKKHRQISLPLKSLQIKGSQDIYIYYLNLFPNLVKLAFEPYYLDIKLPYDALQHLGQLEELSIQSLDKIRLKDLRNLRRLKLTNTFSEQICFQDFQYLDRLQSFVIVPQLNSEKAAQLNKITNFPKGCLVEIRTLFLKMINQLGQIPNIYLKIDNQYLCPTKEDWIIPSYTFWNGASQLKNLLDFQLNICHGEQFTDHQILHFLTDLSKCSNLVQLNYKFFAKRARQACTFTKEQERSFAINTSLLSLDTDLNISYGFQKHINQKFGIFLSRVVFDKEVKPYLNFNPSACYFDLFEQIS